MSRQPLTITVTQADIDEGVRQDDCDCIVATAIGRQIPGSTFIRVTAQEIRFSIGKQRFIYLTPREVATYVIAFDAGAYSDIKPMKFGLIDPLVVERAPRGPRRLTVKAAASSPRRPSATREWGQRVFRVNQKAAAK